MRQILLFLFALSTILLHAELTPVKVKKYYGLQDENGNMVVAPTYTAIGNFSGRYTWVNKGGKCAYEQCPINGKWGVIDDQGNEVCSVVYDYVDLCNGNYVNVNKGGVINIDNRTITGGLWGIYDLANKKEVVHCQYTQLGPVTSDGICWAQKEGNGSRRLLVIVDRDDKNKITNIQYQFYYYRGFKLKDFYERHRDEGKWGLIRVDGTELTKFEFTKVNEFIEGYSVVSKARKLGVVDYQGQQIIPCEYWDITSPRHWGVCWARKDTKYALINLNNQAITPWQYDVVEEFSEGSAWVKVGDFYGLVDTTGTQIIDPHYQKVYPIYNGLAAFMSKDFVGLVNQDGIEIVPPTYLETALRFGDNQFRPVNPYSDACIQWLKKSNGKYDWCNKKGEILATDTKKIFSITDTIPSALWDY